MEERLMNLQLSILLYGLKDIIKKANLNIEDDNAIDYIITYLAENHIINKDNEDIYDVLKYDTRELLQKDTLKSDSLSYIVYEANNIASGTDEKCKDNNSSLRSIFNKIKVNTKSNGKQFQFGSFSQDVFNMPKENVPSLQKQDYENILSNIKKRINKSKENFTPENLLNILEETCIYFPATSYIEQPDISYYDHSKITAAIASSMYIYDEENNIRDFKEEYFDKDNRKKYKFLFVSGEFSGIQSFIYTIASKMAMKSLRGRSFYLELFIEHIIDEILSNLNLSRINLIYSGGSQFYLLLPNTDKAKKVIKNYKEIINDFLLKELGTAIYFEMSYTQTNSEELGNGMNLSEKKDNKIGDIFKRLSISNSKSKLSRYSINQLKSLIDEDSEINKINSYTKECTICKKSENEGVLKKNANFYDNIELCNTCKNYIELGKEISILYKYGKENFIVETNCDSSTSSLVFPKYPEGFVSIELLSKSNISENIHRYYSVNSYNFSDRFCKNIWIGNYNISNGNDDKLIEFKNLVKKTKGIERLAVLRADVDNLGELFQSGFEDKNSLSPYKYVTIAKSAVLSRYLSDFFKRKINIILEKKTNISKNSIFTKYCNIIQEDNTDPRDIVIVYSGGDDLFVIGTWNDVIEFAVDLRTAFSEFTSGKVTLSAGIGFFSENFPIYQMANRTGELEQLAKTYIEEGTEKPTKDSISLFGQMNDNRLNHIYKWDDFINKVLYEKYQYIKSKVKFEESGETDKVFVGKSKWYKIMDLISNRICSEDNRIDIARFAYILARIKSTKDNNTNYEELKKQLLKWMKEKKDAKHLFTAINLLIYEEREKQGEKNYE